MNSEQTLLISVYLNMKWFPWGGKTPCATIDSLFTVKISQRSLSDLKYFLIRFIFRMWWSVKPAVE